MNDENTCRAGARRSREGRSHPRNILWVVTTQWRAQALGYAGDPNARTPWLDAFARESVNFTQAVTPHPFGPFARAALLTGAPSPENGVRDYFDPLPPEARTIAHELRERCGYATAFFGKWHLARRDPRAALVGEAHARMIVPPEARGGFEFWEGFESGFLLNDPWLHGSRLPEPARFSGYQGDVLCGRAAEYLSGRAQMEKGGAPWFCVVSLEAPHPPYDAPAPPGFARAEPGEIALPANVPRGGDVEARARRELAGYYAHVAATDAAIGRLIADVRIRFPDTAIVFTSVHGDMHGAHGLFRKGWPHEESVRVPLLVCDGVNAGVSRAAVSLVDLRGLTLSFAGRAFGLRDDSAAEADWNSALRNKTRASISMPGVVRLPHQCDRAWRGVRTAARKLVVDGAGGEAWLFFDLERDPLELRNLAGDPARAAEIAELMALV